MENKKKEDERKDQVILNPGPGEPCPLNLREASVKVMICSAIAQADNFSLYQSMITAGIIAGNYREEADYSQKELTLKLYGRLVDMLYLDQKKDHALQNGVAALSVLFSV